jgi:hypothetical protein
MKEKIEQLRSWPAAPNPDGGSNSTRTAAEQLPSSLSFSCMLMRVEGQYAMEAQRNWPAHRVKEVQPSYLSKYNHV